MRCPGPSSRSKASGKVRKNSRTCFLRPVCALWSCHPPPPPPPNPKPHCMQSPNTPNQAPLFEMRRLRALGNFGRPYPATVCRHIEKVPPPTRDPWMPSELFRARRRTSGSRACARFATDSAHGCPECIGPAICWSCTSQQAVQ